MMKKFTSKGKKILASLIALTISFGVLISSDALLAEEAVLILSKESFIDEVLRDNTTLIDMEKQINDLNDQLDSMAGLASSLGAVHNMVPRYNELGEKYIAAPDTMTMGELGEYYFIGDYMRMFGIKSKTVSAQQEYDVFIAPIYISNRSIKSGIESLKDGVISASDAIEVGATQLYNTVLMMNGLMELLELTYSASSTNYDFAVKRHDKGLLTDISLKISYNEMLSAKLNRDKMIRDIENLKMNMNIMMGKKATVAFTVGTVEVSTIELYKLNNYIDSALVQRSEIISLNRAIEDQDFKRMFIRNTFAKTDIQYILEQKQLELLKIDLANTKNNITLEIHKAYNNILEKEIALEIAYKDLEEANRQYAELAINIEQGFVTESMLSQLNMLVTNSINDVATKSRDYLAAVESLTNASSFGPAYTNGGGF